MQTSFFYRFADWDEQISKGCKMQKKYKKNTCLLKLLKENRKLFQGKHEPLSPSRNIEPIYSMDEAFRGNQNAKLQVARDCQTVARKFSNGRETIDMKAVVNHS